MEILKLPVGIDNFEKIRRNNFYYIDKTKLVEQALHNWSEVTLFTRKFAYLYHKTKTLWKNSRHEHAALIF